MANRGSSKYQDFGNTSRSPSCGTSCKLTRSFTPLFGRRLYLPISAAAAETEKDRRIRQLERTLGRKSLEIEILKTSGGVSCGAVHSQAHRPTYWRCVTLFGRSTLWYAGGRHGQAAPSSSDSTLEDTANAEIQVESATFQRTPART